jgi:1-phosphatidylinositol-3-phosphate 5-kinase
MLHLKVMLRQMLTFEGIPNIGEWEEILLRLALRIAREMTFTALPHRQGQDMDVRRYVKIKKIPGGTPKDSEYVNGAVITKNVAHKQMSRLQANPRVMLVTFPLEFSRVEGQYLHFGQILRQEKEYLGNLASRIAALRPHVVLVEQSVSRLALEALAQHNIAVARTVKPSAIQTVSRMTQGDVFSSMDKLALEPRLGHCTRFCIQSYDHALIPGQRKTYMRFEGCNRDMGCTIILRGGDLETLRRIKKVTRFLTFIVRNLKLETHLWKDSVISLPSFNAQAIPPSGSRHLQLNRSTSVPTSSVMEVASVAGGNDDEDLPNEDAERLRLTRRIDESLEPYTNTFISVSATLRFPPPYPIRRMKELDNSLMDAKRAWEDEIVRIEERLHLHKQEETVKEVATPAVTLEVPEPQQGGNRDDIVAQIDALVVTDRSTTKDGLPMTSTLDDYFTFKPGLPTTPFSSNALMQSGSNFVHTEEPEHPKTEVDIFHQSSYSLLKWQHEEHRRIWEWYLRKNQDDFFDVEKYQCIHLREYIIPGPDAGHRPCFSPCLRRIKFYGENDLTLGRFIEKVVNDTLVNFLDPKAICTGKGCDQPLARHCKVYVHNETRLFVAVEQWGGQIIGRSSPSPSPYPSPYPSPDLITTWSACRVCGSATPFIPVSEEMQRYSFAKFLELHFYPADVKLVQGAGCQHNIYQHHIRYFASKGMTVRFQADPVVPYELVYPPFHIRVRPETQLDLKNDEFTRLHLRNDRWYSALVDELKSISIDASTGDEEHDARLLADVNALIIRAEAEREDICRLINQLYRDSLPTDTLGLNKVHAYRRDKRVAWDIDFDRLPKARPLLVKRNSRRASAFGTVRAMWPGFDNSQLPSSSVSEAEEYPLNKRFTSSPSETSETESGVDLEKKAAGLEKDNIDSEKRGIDSEKKGTDLAKGGVDLENISPEVDVVDGQTPREDKAKSDPDSDSTIGAVREEIALPTTFVPSESVSFLECYIVFVILLIPFLCRNKTQGCLPKIHLSVRHDCREVLLKI